MATPSQEAVALLWVLNSGNWTDVNEIHRLAGPIKTHSRIMELRDRGYTIEHRISTGGEHQYRLEDHALDRDKTPRDKEHRYRLYSVTGDALVLVATAASEREVGVMLVKLAREGQFTKKSFGLLDTHGKSKGEGDWLVNPWNPPKKPA